MSYRLANMVFAVLIVMVGIIIVYHTQFLPLGGGIDPGPRLWPQTLGAALTLCGVLLLVESFRGTGAKWGAPLVSGEGGRVALGMAALISYALLLKRLGYFLSTFLALVVLTALGRRPPSKLDVLAVPALFLAGVYLLFVLLLRVPLL